MTPEELNDKMIMFQLREHEALKKLERLARTLLPVLKDHKLENTAQEIGAILFEIDATKQEVATMLGRESEAAMEWLRGLKG